MDTTHAIVEVETEYGALLGDPRRSLSRFVEVSIDYARMVSEPDPDRALEVLALALETLHDPPAPAETPLALELLRSRRAVARRLGMHLVERDSIERERRIIDGGLVADPDELMLALGRRSAAIRFAEGNAVGGFSELTGCLADLGSGHGGDRDDRAALSALGEVVTDLVLALRRHHVPRGSAEALEAVAVELRRDRPDGEWTAWCLVVLAALRLHAGDAVTAQMYLRRAEGNFATSAPVVALLLAGWVGLAAEDHERALDRFRGAAEAAPVDERLRLLIRAGTGESLIGLGRPAEARAPLSEAIAYEVGDPSSLARCHELLGELAAAEQRFGEAYEHLRATRRFEELARRPPEPPVVGRAASATHATERAVPAEIAMPAEPAEPAEPEDGDARELIAAGLAHGWFELHVQPVAGNERGRPGSVEALVRLAHPERGLLTPAQFGVDFAASGLGVELEEWVIAEACRTLRQWDDHGLSVSLSVNVSRQRLTAGFVAAVRRSVVESGARPDRLVVEVKAQVLGDAVGAELDALGELRSMGIRLAIDNFSHRPGSLEALVGFPVDVVKIDCALIGRSAAGPEPDRAAGRAVDAILALAGSLGFQVVAERVETAAQLDLQRVRGCHGAQGFLIGRPGPPALFADLMTGLALFDTMAAGARAA